MAAKKSGWWIAIIIIFVIGILWYWYMRMYPTKTSITPQSTSTVVVKGQITVENNLFIPETTTVAVGDTVTWINKETYGHNIVSDDGTFTSPKLATGDTFSYKFTKAGTYTYSCSIHPFMHGTIIVTK